MKRNYLTIVLSLWLMYAGAQNFQWAKREGLYAYDYGYGISTDNGGNVYVGGKYEQAGANFSGTTLTCAGNHDAWLAKYSSTGSLQWIRTAGGTLGDYAHNIATDGVNSVVMCGEIEGFSNIISFPGSTITVTSIGDNDVFLAKYDLNGNLLWAKSAGWKYSEKAQDVAYDNSGNIIICGYFTDTTQFYGPPIPGAGYRDVFVAKYDANGNFLWMKTAGSSGRDEGKSIVCDATGNIYVAGMNQAGAMFGGNPVTTSGSYLDAFIAKYDPNGNIQWVKTGGGSFDDVAWGLAIDNSGKIYMTGEFNAYATFGSTSFPTAGRADVFVTCYDAAGNVLWAKRAGGVLDDRARGIGCNGTNLYITGQFGSTATFDTYAVSAADSSDIFMAGMDMNGSYQWASSVGGPADAFEPLGYESGNDIWATATGEVYATGALLDGGTFASYSVSPYSRTDVFIAKLSSQPSSIGIKEVEPGKQGPGVYPNPSAGNFVIDLSSYGDQKTDLVIYNGLGQMIEKLMDRSKKANLDLSDRENGIYIIEIKPENGATLRSKLIVQK